MLVKILVALLIASFLALDCYLWDSLQRLWSKREATMKQGVRSSKQRSHNLQAEGDQVVHKNEEGR